MWTCALQNRNGMCAQLCLIILRCSYEEAFCPCLPIKRIAKPLIRLGGWPRCEFVRFSMIFGPLRGRITRGWKMSMYSFQRWASDDFGPIESRAWSKRRPYMGSTGLVFAPYWLIRQTVGCSKASTASAKKFKNTQWTWRTHVTVASQEVDFVRTSHGPQTPMAPQVLRAGAHPRVSCMRPEH